MQDRVTIPAGTRLLIRTIDPIDTGKQRTGYRFTASLETNLEAEGMVVASRGTTVYGRLAQAYSAGGISPSSRLTLELTSISISGSAPLLLNTTYEIKGKDGALIGGIASGGSAAGVGALAGVPGGTAVAGSKKGEQLQIPRESLLEFRLEQPAILSVER